VKQGGISCDMNVGPDLLVEAMKPQIEAYNRLNKSMSIMSIQRKKIQPVMIHLIHIGQI